MVRRWSCRFCLLYNKRRSKWPYRSIQSLRERSSSRVSAVNEGGDAELVCSHRMGLFSRNTESSPPLPSSASGTNRLRRRSLNGRRSSTYSAYSVNSTAPTPELVAPPVSQLAYRDTSTPTSPTSDHVISMQQQQQSQYYNGSGAGNRPYDAHQSNQYRNSPPVPSGRMDGMVAGYNGQNGGRDVAAPGGGYTPSPPPGHLSSQQQPEGRNSPNTAQQQYHGDGGVQQYPMNGTLSSRAQQQRPMSYMGPQTSQQQHSVHSPVITSGHGYSQSMSQAGSQSYTPSTRSPSNHSPAPPSSAMVSAPAGPQAMTSPGATPNNPPIRRGSTASNSPSLPPKVPSTIAGEPLHDMGRAIALLKSSKFYAEGESVAL